MKLAIGLVLALLLGTTTACSTNGSARPSETMWQLIERSADAKGQVSAQTALQAFAYLFGPLPGVNMPSAQPDPPGFKVSGSGPIRWVLNRWPELTDEQKLAVADALTPPKEDPPKLRSAPSPKDSANAVIGREVADLILDIGIRLGGATISAPTFTLVDKEEPGARAWTNVLADGEWIFPFTRDKFLPKGGPTKRCDMYFPPSIWQATTSSVPANIRQSIVHELMHCFQGFSYSDASVYRAAGQWLNDGGAEWAGIDIAGVSDQPPPNNWTGYLNARGPLFARTYNAVGWWFHIQHVGHDPWKNLPAVWRGDQTGQEAYVTLGGAADDVYDTWASSLLRIPSFGDAWEVHGKDVPAYATPHETLIARLDDIEVAPVDARVAEIVPVPDAGEIVRISAAYPVRFHDNLRFEDVHFTEADYCVGEKCVCPKDTEREGERIQQVSAPLWLAVPGGESGNNAVVDTITLEEYCKKKPPERRKPKKQPQADWAPAHGKANNRHGPRDDSPAPQGKKSGTAGDPHLTSLDGRTFDFQAAGEFTLVRADGGDLEVQARQEPVRFGDRESDKLTMNTAIAASVAGDRVTFTPRQDRPEVRVNGRPSGEQTLPRGGKLTSVESGYELRWPDGTGLWVLSGSAESLNALIEPAPSRKGKLHGMLGPFEGNADSTAMTERGGRRYDKPNRDELYKKIGESWRIRQSDSLFDYRSGESTDTFTRRELPAKELTLADLSAAQRAVGERACAGVSAELHDQCVFDVAASGNDKFAVGYRTMDKLTTVGGGTLSLDRKVGPLRLEAGQQQTFTYTTDADALYFATDADCTKATSATVSWRVIAPDGSETLQVPMCADAGRRTTGKSGTWRVNVWVPPGADQGGLLALHVETAGELRKLPARLPSTVDNGTLRGAGAEDRHQFTASAGDKVTITAKRPCDDDGALYWGLESPDGNVITLRTRACQNLGQQTIPTAGTWSVVIFNRTSDEGPHRYAFSITRP
jgi:hypothetical protein